MVSHSDELDSKAGRAPDFLGLSTDIVAVYVGKHAVSPSTIPELIRTVHQALLTAGSGGAPPAPEKNKPAVPVSRSVQRDHIVCLEDGKHLKMLKRYLRTHYDMSPEQYRRKWGLPADYPMVAPDYAAQRSEFAKHIGLGKGVRRGL